MISPLVMLHGSDTYFISDLCADETPVRQSCMNTNDLIVTLPQLRSNAQLKRCNFPFTYSLSKCHNSTIVTVIHAEVMPIGQKLSKAWGTKSTKSDENARYLKCGSSQLVASVNPTDI